MLGDFNTVLVVSLGVGLAVCLIYFRAIGNVQDVQDVREPPIVSGSIPYIGHVIGIMRSKFNYYVQLSRQSSLPIFTMTMPGQKMYIITTPDLVQAVQKQPKVLAFPPIEAKFASTVCGVSPEAHKILLNNVNGDEGNWGLSMDSYAVMRFALAPGPALDTMNRVMIQNIAASLDNVFQSGQMRTTTGLAEWLRKTITLATTNAVYGPQNPFKDQAVQDAFWQFESELMTILVGFVPSLMARKGIAGRTKVANAFKAYFEAGGHKRGSLLVQNRYDTSSKYGVSVEDIARYEVGGSIAILVNTAPAVFWTLLYIYSHPAVLEAVRKEVGLIVTSEPKNSSSGKTWSLDISNVKTDCPLLASTYQEVLRHRSMGTSVRQVMEDTVLDGKWLLKKDCMIQMPSRVIHKDPSLWGNDVDDFVPRRFVKDETQKTSTGKRPPATAFRAFGGGSTLCPGRHFATNEILAVVTMFVMRYEMAPVSGSWEYPSTDNTNVAAVVMEPDSDVEVRIEPREGYEDGHWEFSLKDSDKIFAIVAEDKE